MVDGIFFIVSILIFRFIFPLFVYLTSLSPSPPLFSLYPYLSFSIGLLSTFPIYVILTSFFLSLTLVLSHYILYVLVQHNVLLSILFTTTYHSSKEICSLKIVKIIQASEYRLLKTSFHLFQTYISQIVFVKICSSYLFEFQDYPEILSQIRCTLMLVGIVARHICPRRLTQQTCTQTQNICIKRAFFSDELSLARFGCWL